MRTHRLFAYAGAFLVALACAAGHGQDKPAKKPSLMEKKLASAQKVLEGLAKNDFEAIRENSGILNDLSKQAAWKMVETPRYETYSEEFQRITLKMMNQGKDKNLDGAALSYVDMTLMCVKCHQHVREVRMGRGE
jgi:hypothetical protein